VSAGPAADAGRRQLVRITMQPYLAYGAWRPFSSRRRRDLRPREPESAASAHATLIFDVD